MERKTYDRKNARGILTPTERNFLITLQDINRPLLSRERKLRNSIERKARKGVKDLHLILEKMPYYRTEILFNEEDVYPIFDITIGEIVESLYSLNYRKEFWRLRKVEMKKEEPDNQVICDQTRNQIIEIVNVVLNDLTTQS
jgi:hypothetical protein